MPDKTPPRHAAGSGLPARSVCEDSTRSHTVSGLFTRSCPSPVGFIFPPRTGALRASRVLQRLCSCMPRPEDSGGPPRPSHRGRFVLPSSALNLSASATSCSRSCTSTSKERDLPCGRPDSLCTLAPSVVRELPHSAMAPTLHTGGWLTLARRGLPPRKSRRAFLGARTIALSHCGDQRRSRCIRAAGELGRGETGSEPLDCSTYRLWPRLLYITDARPSTPGEQQVQRGHDGVAPFGEVRDPFAECGHRHTGQLRRRHEHGDTRHLEARRQPLQCRLPWRGAARQRDTTTRLARSANISACTSSRNGTARRESALALR